MTTLPDDATIIASALKRDIAEIRFEQIKQRPTVQPIFYWGGTWFTVSPDYPKDAGYPWKLFFGDQSYAKQNGTKIWVATVEDHIAAEKHNQPSPMDIHALLGTVREMITNRSVYPLTPGYWESLTQTFNRITGDNLDWRTPDERKPRVVDRLFNRK